MAPISNTKNPRRIETERFLRLFQNIYHAGVSRAKRCIIKIETKDSQAVSNESNQDRVI